MRNQADRIDPAQVALHIKRQRFLGERMIRDHDQPRKWDLIVTGAVIVGILFWAQRRHLLSVCGVS